MSKNETPTSIPSNAWFALTVKPRHEKAVTQALSGKHFDAFLPTYRSRSPGSQRLREFTLPLFPGYVFCRFDPEMRLPVITVPGVISIISFGKALAPIKDCEIANLQKLVSSDLPLKEFPYFESGDPVRIETGPLRGIEGVVDKRSRPNRFVVSITLLRRSVAVVLDETFLRLAK